MIYLILSPTIMVTTRRSFCHYNSSTKRRTFLTSTIDKALADTNFNSLTFESIDDAISNLIACTGTNDFSYATADTHPEFFL